MYVCGKYNIMLKKWLESRRRRKAFEEGVGRGCNLISLASYFSRPFKVKYCSGDADGLYFSPHRVSRSLSTHLYIVVGWVSWREI